MNLVQIIKLDLLLNRISNVLKEGPMTPTKLAQIGALIAQAAGSFGAAAVIAPQFASWGWAIWVLAALNFLLSIGHALLPSMIPAPLPLPSSSTATKVGMILLFLLAGTTTVHAQTTAPIGTPITNQPSNGLVTSSDAVAVDFKGVWSTGNITKVGYDIFDYGALKSNHVYVESTDFLAPTANLSFYGGGAALQPNISGLFKNLNVSPGNFSFLLDGGGGVLNIASATTSASHPAGYAGVALKYNFTSNTSLTTIRAESVFAGGTHFYGLSTGITHFFGK